MIRKLFSLSGWLLAGIIASVAAYGLTGCHHSSPTQSVSKGSEKQAGYYTCPMHPQVRSDRPGKCPICGMTLEFHALRLSPLDTDTPSTRKDSSLSFLVQPVTQTVIGMIPVVIPLSHLPATNSQAPSDTIQAFGYLTYDERYTRLITPRVSGRIEALYVHALYERVNAGQPLMKIYSPELLTLQRYWIQALREHDTALSASLQQNLLHQGMLPEELQKVRQTLQPLVEFTLTSPVSGWLYQPEGRQNFPEASWEADATTEPIQLPFVVGSYVKAGVPVLAIQTDTHFWAIVQVSNNQLAGIWVGDPVELYREGMPNQTVRASIDFIPPDREPGRSHFAALRVYLPVLPAGWKVNQLIRARVFPHVDRSSPERGKNLFVPRSAVDDLGRHQVVWVQDVRHPEVFHAREVRLGISSDDWVQVVAGLKPGERIARQAGYMVDSDSFVTWSGQTQDTSEQ
ncbi:MAG: efflux RND transporter periplasmic adaptor subunit [Thermoflavifilum aggregans]|nr:efflux RND transporter periplasmic adaptor subunit [Thermoflavifilum aggregans]